MNDMAAYQLGVLVADWERRARENWHYAYPKQDAHKADFFTQEARNNQTAIHLFELARAFHGVSPAEWREYRDAVVAAEEQGEPLPATTPKLRAVLGYTDEILFKACRDGSCHCKNRDY